MYNKFEKRVSLIRWVGQQEFDMPKAVMDAAYNQTLCWIGIFFSPYIPLMITIKMVIFFWVKKVTHTECCIHYYYNLSISAHAL